MYGPTAGSPFGMLLVNLCNLRYHNVALTNVMAMLRVDDELFWTESARATNGQVRTLHSSPSAALEEVGGLAGFRSDLSLYNHVSRADGLI